MTLKLTTLATTSLVALGLTIAPANAAGMTGDFTFGYGWAWDDFDDNGDSFESEYPALFGTARVNLPYSDTVNLQFTADSRASMEDSVFENKSNNSGQHFALGTHINYRDDRGLLGVFGATGRMHDNFSFFGSGQPIYLAGFEGQYFCNQWTVRSQLAYLDSDEGTLMRNAGLARLGVNYYHGKQWKFTGDLYYVAGETGFSSDDVVQWYWSVGAEYWFGKSIPVSAFVDYRDRHVEIDDWNSELDNRSVNFGFKFHFGGTDPQSADQTGPGGQLPDLEVYKLGDFPSA